MIRTPMLTGDMNLVSVTGCSGAVRASRTGYGTRPWCSAIWGRASTRTFAGTRGSHAPLASSSADFHAVGNARALALVTHRRFLTGRTTVVRTTLYMPSIIDIPAPKRIQMGQLNRV